MARWRPAPTIFPGAWALCAGQRVGRGNHGAEAWVAGRERERERRVSGDCGEWSGVREIFPGETATGDVVVALEGRRKERRVRRWSTRGSGVGIGEGGMARGAFGWARVKLGRETAQVRGRGEGRPGGPRAPAWAAPKRKRERGRFRL